MRGTTTIRAALQQGTTQQTAQKCAHCGGVKPQDLAVDSMIERAKQMAPKPFKREPLERDPAPRAAADDTRVRTRVPAGRRSIVKPDPMLQKDLETANRNLKKRY